MMDTRGSEERHCGTEPGPEYGGHESDTSAHGRAAVITMAATKASWPTVFTVRPFSDDTFSG